MKKLGVAVVGAGAWGRNHVRAYKEIPITQLVAVCDVDPTRARALAAQFDAEAYTSSEEMLKNKEVEAVSVCTWSTMLAVEAAKALDAGKHVLVEKPMAANAVEAEKLVEKAEENALLLTVGFLMRFIPGLQRIRDDIQKKAIGNLVCATAKRVSQWPERLGDVGVVKDTAIHDIDAMQFITGEQPSSVYARTGCMRHKKFEDYAHIMLTYENGESAFIESNWLTPYKTRTLVVTGSEAIMRLDYMTQELWIENAKESIQPRYPFQEPLKLELQHFAECILEKQKPQISGQDGVKALCVAEAVLKSSAENRVIKIKNMF
jgi:UDP-N-acetylglucosamine 3-dehydrogenase